MNAAEHYEQAIGLLESADEMADLDDANYQVARAQVHATLALTCTVASALEPLARANLSGRNRR